VLARTDDDRGCESVQNHVAWPGFAGEVRLGLRSANRARHSDIEGGLATKLSLLVAPDSVSMVKDIPRGECGRRTTQDKRNRKQFYDSYHAS
jgi:hypothetical protein